MIITLILVVLILVVVILAARPLLISITRTVPWIGTVMSSGVAEKAYLAFGDVVSITGFILTVIGIVVGWQSVKLENARVSLESQIKDIEGSNAELQQTFHSTVVQGDANFAPNVDIHLELPGRDSVLTGLPSPEFQWRYAGHSDRVNYLVEVVRLDFDLPREHTLNLKMNLRVSGECDFDLHRNCTFVATRPAAQRSEIPLKPGKKMLGRFLWRVVSALDPVAPGSPSTPDFGDEQLSEWSEYGSFEIYPDLVSRLRNGSSLADAPLHGGAIVGTTYSDNDYFSRIDRNGIPSGHDIDLIKILIQGCLVLESDAVVYSEKRCIEAATAYARDGKGVISGTRPDGTRVYIRSFSTVDAGLAALRRKEIDVFVGAVTKAKERAQAGLRFSDGYYRFRSVLYVHAPRRQPLERWAQSPQSIGVIANSTNHWLATALSGEPSFGSRLTIVAFPTYWALRNAFERRDIEGLLIDSVLGYDLQHANESDGTSHAEVTGLEGTRAWREYHEWLGYDGEEFAIAVASDQAPRQEWSNQLMNLFYLPINGQGHRGARDLYNPLQAALQSNEIQFILPNIRKNNSVRRPDELESRD